MRTYQFLSSFLFIIPLLFLCPFAVVGQDLSQLNTQIKEYGRPGYSKVTVFVWGNANTGVWSVEEGTDLLEFLSVASRTQMSQQSPDRRRIEILKVYRKGNQGTTGDPFFESRLEDLFARNVSYPTLQEGDIYVIETRVRSRFTWRDITQVTGTVAAILNTYLIINRLN